MPLENEKDLLIVFDNLEQFSEKLLSQVAEDFEIAGKHLAHAIQKARNLYSQPIDTYVTGWVYYFSRTRGPQIQDALQSIETESSSVKRLETFKSLIQKGKLQRGSFNYYLFRELINSLPGYATLDEQAEMLVIKRLNVLLIKKIDEYINSFNSHQRVIEERKQALNILQAQDNYEHVVVLSDLSAAKLDAENQFDKVYFCLTKIANEWQLVWINPTGMEFSLALNNELSNLLHEHEINSIDELNGVFRKRVQKECFAIRDVSFNKIRVQINPERSDTTLCAEGLSSAFVLRGQSGEYRLSWINSLGKATAVDLAQSPQLKNWLSAQELITQDDIIELKAYLSLVNTAHSIGMNDFKTKLQHCLLNQNVAPNKKTEQASKRLNLGLFKDLELCIGKQAGKAQLAEGRGATSQTGKLNLSQYAAVTSLFTHAKSNQPTHQPAMVKHLKYD